MKKMLLVLLMLLSACSSTSKIDGSYECVEENFVVIIKNDQININNLLFKFEEVSENTYQVIIDEDIQIDDAYFEYDTQLDQINLIDSGNDILECPRQK